MYEKANIVLLIIYVVQKLKTIRTKKWMIFNYKDVCRSLHINVIKKRTY